MPVIARGSLQVRMPLRDDIEQEIVARLIEVTGEAGLQVDPISIVNFYVALKSKPLAILAGPAQSGKIALVKSLAHVLTDDDCLRCQTLIGHPCWAAKSPNVALFTEAQTRLNASKILALIEEAGKPGNADKVFHACLTRITPAELLGFFSEVAFQLSHGEIMRLPSIHLTEPIPYPPNLFLIGTMDTMHFDWWNADLLSMATVIQWPAVEANPATDDYRPQAVVGGEAEFLRSCVRSKKLARRKLDRILGWRLQPLEPLRRVRELLEKSVVRRLPQAVMDDMMIYLANSWSQAGIGLFDLQNNRNVTFALDLVIAQTLLPHLAEALSQSMTLIERVGELLNGQFPRSEVFLTSLGRT
jgi:hypothetical protein